MKKIVLPFLLILVLMLAACGGGSASSSFPTGKFIKEGTEDQGMVFNADGTFTAFSGVYTLSRGTYSAEGDVFTELTNNSNGACPAPFDFKYTFDGKNLTFNYTGNPADDPCDGRKNGFDNTTYTLVEE